MTNNCKFHVLLLIFQNMKYNIIMAESKLVKLNFKNNGYSVYSMLYVIRTVVVCCVVLNSYVVLNSCVVYYNVYVVLYL